MREFLWFVPFDTRYLLAVDFPKWEDTNFEIKLCFTCPEVSQLIRGNVTFQKPLPASVHTLGFSSICAGKTSTTLKEGREWGLVFEGYKTKCTCLLKLLFILTGLPKEILQDLEPGFSARKFFFSRQKWILCFSVSFQLEPEKHWLAETTIKACYYLTALPWQTPGPIHTLLPSWQQTNPW